MKNGISWNIPIEILVRRYYCSQCGAKLQKEKTHRVVTKDDVDYYVYQDLDKFPRRNHDVYEYRFKCPHCQARISFEEQCIINKNSKIQQAQYFITNRN